MAANDSAGRGDTVSDPRIRAEPIKLGESAPRLAQGRLQQEYSSDEIAFPEDLIEANQVLRSIAGELSLYDAEWVLVDAADAVVVVLHDDPLVSGPDAEVAQFLADEKFRDRFFVLVPPGIQRLLRGRRVPYLYDFLARHTRGQTIRYDPAAVEEREIVLDSLFSWLLRRRYRKWRTLREVE